MKKVTLISMLTVTFITISGLAVAQASPTAFLKAKDKKLSTLLQKADSNQDKILNVVNKMLNFEALCKDSLGKHWDTRSEEEQKEFTATLKALIEKNLINRLKNTKGRKVTYQSESLDGDKAQVITQVATSDDPRADVLEIEYKLVKGKGNWSVVDMVTYGISLVGNYRSQFNKIITEVGWEALMKKMKDKLAEQSENEKVKNP